MFFGKDVFISLSIVSQESQCVSSTKQRNCSNDHTYVLNLTGGMRFNNIRMKRSWLVVIKCFMKDVAASEIDTSLITVSAIICDKFFATE